MLGLRRRTIATRISYLFSIRIADIEFFGGVDDSKLNLTFSRVSCKFRGVVPPQNHCIGEA
eukprot:1391710-Amorphochlora_amoeboformis.AAC.2